MLINCMIYSKEWTEKPSEKDAGKCRNNLKETQIKPLDLAKILCNGGTFSPAVLSGTTDDTWLNQQFFALDFDHDTTMEIEIKKCERLGLIPAFGYCSFNHRIEINNFEDRFRLVFCCDRIVTDIAERNKIMLSLAEAFFNNARTNVDTQAFNPGRMFFGGKSGSPFYENYESLINIDELLKKYCTSVVEKNAQDMIKSSKTKSLKIKPKKQKAKSNLNNNSNSHIEAIKNLDVKTLKLLLFQAKQREDIHNTNKEDFISYSISIDSIPPALGGSAEGTGGSAAGSDTHSVKLKSSDEIYKYINSLDLGTYLNVHGDGTLFNCILPEHNDSTPSAHIYITDNKTPIYKCFGCNKSFTIIGITEKISGCKRSQAIEFIKSVYNINQVDSEWVIQQKLLMNDAANYFDTEEFKIQFSTLHKIIANRKLHLQCMLIYFTQFINDDMKNEDTLTFHSGYNTLMKVCNTKDRTSFSKTLALFTLLNLLEKVDVTKIPEKELKKAKSIAAKYHHEKLTNFYSFPEFGVNLLEISEDKAKILKANNFTLKGLSREYVIRTFGKDEADRIYPQHKYENSLGTSDKSNKITERISNIILKKIDSKGYIFERNIAEIYIKQYKKGDKKEIEVQTKKSIQEILDSYNLERTKLNNKLKQKYGITSKGYPFLIVKKQLLEEKC